MSGLEATLRRIMASLHEQGVRFAVVGGLAVSARTEPRFTRDADLCVAVQDDPEAEAVVRRLRASGYELLALKVLARDDRTHPQDRLDALALLEVATVDDLETTRDLLRTIASRGYARDRDLLAALDAVIQEASA